MQLVDHLMMGVPDFEATAQQWLDRYGWRAVPAGSFDSMPGWGNWVVPLGDTWVEWVGLLDRSLADPSTVRLFDASVRDGARLLGWVLSVEDLDGHAARLRVTVDEQQATGPVGASVWRRVGFRESRTRPYLPVFMSWSGDAERAWTRRRTAELGNPGLDRAAISLTLSGDVGLYERWLGGLEVPATITQGPPSLQAHLVVGDEVGTVT